jgi:hypothetical protein
MAPYERRVSDGPGILSHQWPASGVHGCKRKPVKTGSCISRIRKPMAMGASPTDGVDKRLASDWHGYEW